jgi:hypothetical protein
MQSDYVLHAVKGLKESFDNAANAKIMQYKDTRLFQIVNTSEFTESFTSTEGLTGVRELSEHETPDVLNLEEGYTVSFSDKRFGGAIEFTESDSIKMKDNTVMIDKYLKRKRNALLVDAYQKFLSDIFYLYNNAFNSSATILAPDAVELCGAHTWASGGTFTNKDTAALDTAAMDTLSAYGGAFTDPEGKPWPIDFDTIVVKKGSAASREARRLFAKDIKPTTIADVNLYQGTMTIIETVYITNALHWFAYDSKKEMPLYVGINKMPSLNEPIRDKNESIRTNCTGFYKVGIINMPFAFYGSTGAA